MDSEYAPIWSCSGQSWLILADVGPNSVEIVPRVVELGPSLVDSEPILVYAGSNVVEAGRTRPKSGRFRGKVAGVGQVCRKSTWSKPYLGRFGRLSLGKTRPAFQDVDSVLDAS